MTSKAEDTALEEHEMGWVKQLPNELYWRSRKFNNNDSGLRPSGEIRTLFNEISTGLDNGFNFLNTLKYWQITVMAHNSGKVFKNKSNSFLILSTVEWNIISSATNEYIIQHIS